MSGDRTRERDAIRELVMRMVEACQRRGRPLDLKEAAQIEQQFRLDYRDRRIVVSPTLRDTDSAVEMYRTGESVEKITSSTGVSRATLYRLLKR